MYSVLMIRRAQWGRSIGHGLKRRKFEFLVAFCLIPLYLGLSEPALAQTCSPVALGVDLTAGSPSTACTGTFNTNINFGGPTTPPPAPPEALTVTLAPGVVVNSTGGAGAVNLANITSPISPAAPGVSGTILADDVSITLNNPAGSHQSALRTQLSGSSTITASGIINVTGGPST